MENYPLIIPFTPSYLEHCVFKFYATRVSHAVCGQILLFSDSYLSRARFFYSPPKAEGYSFVHVRLSILQSVFHLSIHSSTVRTK